MTVVAEKVRLQFAAIPFVIAPDGLRVMLLTSRNKRRWVVPKGWPVRGLKPRDVAAREAFAEAGLVGRIVGRRPIGSYHYSRKASSGGPALCQVRVFLLSVDHQVEDWPEKEQREWCWMDPGRAAQMVNEGGLAEIIRDAVPLINRLAPKEAKRRRLPR